MPPRSRSKSDTALEPPTWDTGNFINQMGNIGSALDDSTVSMNEVAPSRHGSNFENGGSPHRSTFGAHNIQPPLNHFASLRLGSAANNFLSPDANMHLRRSKSENGRPTHVRQSRSEDIRSGSQLYSHHDGAGGGDGEYIRASQFLSPVDNAPPSIRGQAARGHIRSASGGSLRSERGTGGTLGGGAGQWSAASSQRASPYPSPNVSPQPHYTDLPPDEMQLLMVSKPNVTTVRTSKASHIRRIQEATFICPVPGCGSTFTRSFNLKGHIRSHNEEKPFLCKWPGCGKGFARQHDCKRHEQLHTNYRPFTCDGCNKQFARMDALNRHPPKAARSASGHSRRTGGCRTFPAARTHTGTRTGICSGTAAARTGGRVPTAQGALEARLSRRHPRCV
ncbi:hypothetical protein GGX14DRAFT_514398 [Mycena pura]|uniref:C2H2-type domain-containing protein n=1 Tax=Mycena pura TaxID=153505 RepID=A0AAD6VTG0_9AGAR|nr:hypothetical protein GGX14DRAFT_514398 [Mycena pura]